jgi:hypothetical protein
MTIIGLSIATWIAIAAVFISLFTLSTTRRKLHNEENLILANQIAEIKKEYSESILLLDKILFLLHDFEKSIKSSKSTKKYSIPLKLLESKSNIENLKSHLKKIYDKLGYQATTTTDPITLASIAVESKHMKETIDLVLGSITKIMEPLNKRKVS